MQIIFLRKSQITKSWKADYSKKADVSLWIMRTDTNGNMKYAFEMDLDSLHSDNQW